MARLRLGVALLLPSPVAEEVNGLRRAVGDRSLGRVPPHVTLVPPVNVRQDELGQVLAVVRAAAAATPRELTITLEAPTSFLPDNPVLYLPLGGDVGAVHALRGRVWEAPLIRSLTWPFVPHVTVADGAPPERIEAAMAALSDYIAVVAITRVHLLVERRPGPHWRPFADIAFGPPSVVARAGPLAVELVRSHQIDPEAAGLLEAEGIELAAPPAAVLGPLVVTARREGEVVGVAAGWLTPDGCHSAVLVATPHRRQGIGRHLRAALAVTVADEGWAAQRPAAAAGPG
ncbi:MAG: GNAT family N-acetyltransferase, partial [Actinomycetota bacterium]|nr:GNAT family N-acetyltransferase [Actinomycetota bacterium]